MTTSNNTCIRIPRGMKRTVTLTKGGALYGKTTPRNEPIVGITFGWRGSATMKQLDAADFALKVGPRGKEEKALVGRQVRVRINSSYALGDTGGRIELKREGDDLLVTVYGAEQFDAADDVELKREGDDMLATVPGAEQFDAADENWSGVLRTLARGYPGFLAHAHA